MKPISDEIDKILGQVFSRHSKVFAEIMINWPKITGTKFASSTSPYKISNATEKGRKINILHVRTENSATSLEFTFHHDIIIERISVYFGYKTIDKIIVKVFSNPIDQK